MFHHGVQGCWLNKTFLFVLYKNLNLRQSIYNRVIDHNDWCNTRISTVHINFGIPKPLPCCWQLRCPGICCQVLQHELGALFKEPFPYFLISTFSIPYRDPHNTIVSPDECRISLWNRHVHCTGVPGSLQESWKFAVPGKMQESCKFAEVPGAELVKDFFIKYYKSYNLPRSPSKMRYFCYKGRAIYLHPMRCIEAAQLLCFDLSFLWTCYEW